MSNDGPPLDLVLERSGSPVPGSKIGRVYDDAGNGLLILGDAGTGKTRLLYELAHQLLDRAMARESDPLPVWLDLSSWGLKRAPMEEWLVDELWRSYRVVPGLARRWLPEGRLTLLLDGLDQLDQQARSACIDAINRLHRTWLLAPVVCCRQSTYVLENPGLTLRTTVSIRPLNDEQVVSHLERLGPPVRAVLDAVRADAQLRELLRTPLMLRMAVSSYRDMTTIDLPESAGPDELRRVLFERYLQRRLNEHTTSRRSSSEQLRRSLIWLARMMRERNQSLFFLERLQPDWLGPRAQAVYPWFGVTVLNFAIGAALASAVGNLVGLSDLTGITTVSALTGVVAGLLVPPDPSPRSNGPTSGWWLGHVLARGAFMAVVVALSIRLYIGSSNGAYPLPGWGVQALFLAPACFVLVVLLGILSHSGIFRSRSPARASGFLDFRRIAWHDARNGLLAAALYLICFGVANFAMIGPRVLYAFLVLGSTNVGGFGVVIALLSMVMSERNASVRPVEVVVVSWRHALRRMVDARPVRPALVIGGVSFTIILIVDLGGGVGLAQTVPASAFFGVLMALLWLLLGGFYTGLAGDLMPEGGRITPNEGMHRSVRNGLLVGLAASGIAWVTVVAGAATAGGSSFAIRAAGTYALFDGISWMVLGGLLYGGAAWLQHATIRVLMALEGSLPLRAVEFLEDAESRALLRRSGGGYVFVHDLFRDHLASTAGGSGPAGPVLHTQS
jgi:hypothetical protein